VVAYKNYQQFGLEFGKNDLEKSGISIFGLGGEPSML